MAFPLMHEFCMPQQTILRVHNTFLDVVEVPEAPQRRSSSCPPRIRASNDDSMMTRQKEASQQAVQMELSDVEGAMDEVFGLDPSSPLWQGCTKVMIRNIPSRCTEAELEHYIESFELPGSWSISLPVNRGKKNRGYGFVDLEETSSAMMLVKALWQQQVPSRNSERPLKLQPAVLMQPCECGQLL